MTLHTVTLSVSHSPGWFYHSRQDSAEISGQANAVARLPRTISTTTGETPLLSLTFNKDVGIRKFESIYVDLFFNSPEHYSLIETGMATGQNTRQAGGVSTVKYKYVFPRQAVHSTDPRGEVSHLHPLGCNESEF